MSCKSARYNPDEGRYMCEVSGDECMYITPNSKRCAEEFGEGPDSDITKQKCENCDAFYLDDKGKRCCKHKPLGLWDGQIIPSIHINDDVVSCGRYQDKK